MTLREENQHLRKQLAEAHENVQEIIRYLSSSKFSCDPYVNRDDILERLQVIGLILKGENAMQQCKTCRYFSWPAYYLEGIGFCLIHNRDAQPETKRQNCFYQYDKTWRYNQEWARKYASDITAR